MNKHVRGLVVTGCLMSAMMVPVLAMAPKASSSAAAKEETSPVSSSSASQTGVSAAKIDITELQEKANKGDADAQCNLGRYYIGALVDGVETNLSEAFKWFKKAAKQGNPLAQFSLGWCYENGYGTVQDQKKADEWFEKCEQHKGFEGTRTEISIKNLISNLQQFMKLVEELSSEDDEE